MGLKYKIYKRMSLQEMSGLFNLGNTCYLNTTLQCLFHTPLFTKFVLQLQRVKQTDASVLIASLQQLLQQKQKQVSPINPETFVKLSAMLSIKNHQQKGGEVFVIGQQHDMVEYLQYLFDCFHEALSYPVQMQIDGQPLNHLDRLMITSLQVWEQFFAKEYSIIVEHFTGQYLSVTNTLNQSDFHEVFDPFSILTLPIPVHKNPISLYDCLDLFVSSEEMIIDNVQKNKVMFLWKLPTILIIHLKRFHNGMRKITSQVDIPLTLDMTKYCKGYDQLKSHYELYAVGNHSGGLQGGHYYATCKTPFTEQWFVYNDNVVSSIPSESVITPNAYCLFYERR